MCMKKLRLKKHIYMKTCREIMGIRVNAKSNVVYGRLRRLYTLIIIIGVNHRMDTREVFEIGQVNGMNG